MARIFCPTCREEFDTEKTAYMPFCSQRCKLIDLGRWLNEEHAVTVERDAELQHFRHDEREVAD